MIPMNEKIQDLLNSNLRNIPKKTVKTQNALSFLTKFLKREVEWKASEVEYKKETDWAFLKNHYPDPDQLTTPW